MKKLIPTFSRTAACAGIGFTMCLFPFVGSSAISWVGNGYLELSTVQSSPQYYVNGGTFGSTVTLGQTLFLGGQAQTWSPTFGTSVTLFYRVGTSGTYSSINLSYYQTANGNDWWDSNGALNYNHTYTSVNIGSLLKSGGNTVQFYYSATDGGAPIFDGSSGSPWSVTVNAVVPEPVSLALPVFLGLFIWGRKFSPRQFTA